VLRNLGPAVEACRIPIVISSRAATPEWRLIGNFAPTPFEDERSPAAAGCEHGSVLAGTEVPRGVGPASSRSASWSRARRLGQEAGYPEAILYGRAEDRPRNLGSTGTS